MAKPTKNKITFIAAECSPFAKVGGLADVIGSLPLALAKIGVEVDIIMPYYQQLSSFPFVLWQRNIQITGHSKKFTVDIYQITSKSPQIKIYAVAHPLISRGPVYAKAPGANPQRFALFSAAAAEILKLLPTFPHLLHLHDWHTALIPSFLKQKRINLPTILTIHNLGNQGIWPKTAAAKLINLENIISQQGVVNFLLNGIVNSTFITTVSPSYAKEILTPAYGMGLEKYLNKRRRQILGIINGIDYQIFNPATDPHIFKKYNPKTLGNKTINKTKLQAKLNLPVNNSLPLLAVVSRLYQQKGLDLLLDALPSLLKHNWQLVVLGTGDKQLEQAFKKAARLHPDRLKALLKFDLKLAQQIYAAADMIVIPSRFEPCGLTQMIAMRYGTVPIARATGGLKDTITPYQQQKGKVYGNGFLFKQISAAALSRTIAKALKVYDNKNAWDKLKRNCLKQDFSWHNSAKQYLKLYQRLIKS